MSQSRLTKPISSRLEESGDPTLQVHAIVERSSANGPGVRAVVWTQGCSIGCPGCFNPETHSPLEAAECWFPDRLAMRLAHLDIEGLTITGGEPLDQAAAVLDLAHRYKVRSGRSVLLLTGYSREALPCVLGPSRYQQLVRSVDVVVAGPFRRRLRQAHSLSGSCNKEIVHFSDQYEDADIERTPVAEVIISLDGTVVSTGVDPVVLTSEAQ